MSELAQMCREKLATVPDAQLVAYSCLTGASEMLKEKAMIIAMRGAFAGCDFTEADLDAMREDVAKNLAAMTLASNRLLATLDEIKEATGTPE